MARSSHKKFLKQEKAKVKLKNKKELLPKGCNVTDLNYKVKKIVIQTQLRDHSQHEPLSSKKLSLQEVLMRLDHHNCLSSLEAAKQLEEILLSCSGEALSSQLSFVASRVSSLITSPHASLRKPALKLLNLVLKQVDANEWSVLKARVLAYIVCGLSHVEPGIRRDSLLALECVPSNLSLPAESLLPSLLDLMSTSGSSGSRSLLTTLSSSPTAHRTSVLHKILRILTNIQPESSVVAPNKSGLNGETDSEEVVMDEHKTVRVPLVSSFPLHQQGLSICDYNGATSTSTEKFDLKSFTLSLVPLMLDSFAEIAPEVYKHERGCELSMEEFSLLDAISQVLLQIHHLDYHHSDKENTWMRETFGSEIYKRLVEGRFPYSEKPLVSKKRSSSATTEEVSVVRVNLTLALLTQLLVPRSASDLIPSFLADLIRSDEVAEEERDIFGRCLLACLQQQPLTKPAANLLANVIKVKRSKTVYGEVFSVLSKLVLREAVEGVGSPVSRWLDNILDSSDGTEDTYVLSKETVELLTNTASRLKPPLNFQERYHLFLSHAVKVGGNYEISVLNLLYWIEVWDSALLDLLQSLVQDDLSNPRRSSHITNLIMHRCERYPSSELFKSIQEHPYWKHIVNQQES